MTRHESLCFPEVVDPPEGRNNWTMQLLADQLVTLDLVENISDETVRKTLKKTKSNRGSNNSGAFQL